MSFSDLPEVCKPFVAAILVLDDGYQPEIVAQFRPELILPVHQAFAAHLFALTLESEHGSEAVQAVAAEHLAVVERAGLLPAAWASHAWLKAQGQSLRAIAAASKPPGAPLH